MRTFLTILLLAGAVSITAQRSTIYHYEVEGAEVIVATDYHRVMVWSPDDPTTPPTTWNQTSCIWTPSEFIFTGKNGNATVTIYANEQRAIFAYGDGTVNTLYQNNTQIGYTEYGYIVRMNSKQATLACPNEDVFLTIPLDKIEGKEGYRNGILKVSLHSSKTYVSYE